MASKFDFMFDWQSQETETPQPVSDKEVLTEQKQPSKVTEKVTQYDWKGVQSYWDFEPIPPHMVGIN